VVIESFRGPVLMSLEQAREAAPEMGGLGTREHERSLKAVRRGPNATKMMRKRLACTAYRLGADVPCRDEADRLRAPPDGLPPSQPLMRTRRRLHVRSG
jgi:hypothetical protein